MTSSPLATDPDLQPRQSLFDRIGISIGTGLGLRGCAALYDRRRYESGSLSPSMVERGLSNGAVASVFTLHGVARSDSEFALRSALPGVRASTCGNARPGALNDRLFAIASAQRGERDVAGEGGAVENTRRS